MRSRNQQHVFAILFMLSAGFIPAHGQQQPSIDTSYYVSYRHQLTTRIYLSQKYVHLNFPDGANGAELEYKANTKLNLGAGFTWRALSVNIFYGFSALNTDQEKGATKGLDLQLNLYPRKWAINLNAIFPKGYHLEPKGYASSDPGGYYYRPDIKLNQLSLSAYRVPNKARFSYRAALLQTEWQKRSAGSFLFGGNAYTGSAKGDSALVPKVLQGSFPEAGIEQIRFTGFGPGAGYAYTLVMGGHFFITGSLIANLNLCFTEEKTASGSVKKTDISPTTNYKAAAGYNSSKWNVSANWTGNGIWFAGSAAKKDYFWPVGHYRVVIARRFDVSKKPHQH